MFRKSVLLIGMVISAISVGNASTLTIKQDPFVGMWESVWSDSGTGINVLATIQFFEDGSFVWEAYALYAPVTFIASDDGLPTTTLPALTALTWVLTGTWRVALDSTSVFLFVSDHEADACLCSPAMVDQKNTQAYVRKSDAQLVVDDLQSLAERFEKAQSIEFLYQLSQYTLSFQGGEDDTVFYGSSKTASAAFSVWQWNRIYEAVN